MKLLFVIVQDADAERLQKTLIKSGYGSTKLASTGGFLRQGNTTFLIGVKDDEVAGVQDTIHSVCRERKKLLAPKPWFAELHGVLLDEPTEVTVGGAVVFVLDVEAFTRL
jgi:uncharacterized protein YaaQ